MLIASCSIGSGGRSKNPKGNGKRSGKGSDQGMMKIYLLMALIGAIAAMSHLKLARKAPEHEA